MGGPQQQALFLGSQAPVLSNCFGQMLFNDASIGGGFATSGLTAHLQLLNLDFPAHDDQAGRHVRRLQFNQHIALGHGLTVMHIHPFDPRRHRRMQGTGATALEHRRQLDRAAPRHDQHQQQAERLGWPAMHAQLAHVDPTTAARLAPGDSQRIGRALEVWTATGQTLTSYHQSAKSNAPDWHMPIISLEPADRSWLHGRIAQRFDQMMAAGFMDEVQSLRQRGDLNPDLPSMRCVGYRQAWEGLDAGWPEAEIRERGIFATRQLAKRQITWLRSMPQRTVVVADGPQDPITRVVELAQEYLLK